MANVSLVLNLLGGLALFLYGMSLMSSGMEHLAEARVRNVLAHCTRNVLIGVLTGIVITILLDSSSLVIVLLVGAVSARLATLEQAMGLVMGANIGTTFSTQLFALQVEELAPVALAVGLLLPWLGRSERVKRMGAFFLGIGILFIGLREMGEATAPLRDNARMLAYLQRLEQPVLGALAGAAATAIIQSSSAMMGIVIALANAGAMTFQAGVALMFGAEIGTCADTLLATIGRSREALRVGVFHLLFNVVSVALGLVFAGPFVTAIERFSGGAPVAQKLANAHMIFNALGVLLFVGLTGPIARALRSLLPDRASNELSWVLPPGTESQPSAPRR